MKKIFKIGSLIMVLGLLSFPAWSSDNAGMSKDNLFIAVNGHGLGDGTGPLDEGDCDGDGPWWEAAMSKDNLTLANNGHGLGDGTGPLDEGDCDGDGPWWKM